MKASTLLIGTIVLISFFGFLAFQIKKQKNPDITLKEFLNSGKEPPSMKTILIGLVFGIVFGFIDNAGLWFGMDALDKYLPGGPLTKAGYGNTYSDFLGATLGTFIGIIFKTLMPVDNIPIWADTIGILIGCLLGIFIPKALTGKN